MQSSVEYAKQRRLCVRGDCIVALHRLGNASVIEVVATKREEEKRDLHGLSGALELDLRPDFSRADCSSSSCCSPDVTKCAQHGACFNVTKFD